MKVLLTADTLGGVWSYALELVGAMPGVQFVVAALGDAPNESQLADAARLPNLLLESCPGRLEWMPGSDADVARTGAWLERLARRHAPDLVHLDEYAHATRNWNVPVLVVAHSCVPSWWRAVHDADPPATWDDYRRRVLAAVARADCVVAPTQAYLREFTALHGAARRRYAIYNACSAAPAAPGGQRLPIVLGAGRFWDEGKNLATLDQAAGRLRHPVYVAGERRAPQGGHRPCANVMPLGALSRLDLRAWMERAAVFASPSLYEPFGLAPLEAALAGCALVLADLPSLRELWNGAATFVPARDAAGWARALEQLLGDPRRREHQARRARDRAQLFAPARMADSYRAVYRELAPAARWNDGEARAA